jgi:hypothetical protein
MGFWNGFFKQAGLRIGMKAPMPLSAAGKMVGNKPASGVSTASHFKPNPIATPGKELHSASKNLSPVPSMGKVIPSIPMRSSRTHV